MLGDLVKSAVQNSSTHADEIIAYATARISELGESTDSLLIEDEIVNIINRIAGKKQDK